MQRFHVFHAYDTDIFRDWTRITGFTVEFEVDCESIVDTAGSIQYQHRNLCRGPVGFITRLSLRRADTLALLPAIPGSSAPNPSYLAGSNWIKGVKSGGNIASIEDHYGTSDLRGRAIVSPGAYRLEAWAVSHSTAAPSTDGLAEVYTPSSNPTADPYNQLIVDVYPK